MPVYIIQPKRGAPIFVNAKSAGDAFQKARDELKTGFTVREPGPLERAIYRQKIKEIGRVESTPGK